MGNTSIAYNENKILNLVTKKEMLMEFEAGKNRVLV